MADFDLAAGYGELGRQLTRQFWKFVGRRRVKTLGWAVLYLNGLFRYFLRQSRASDLSRGPSPSYDGPFPAWTLFYVGGRICQLGQHLGWANSG